jgi:hypothetical protein
MSTEPKVHPRNSLQIRVPLSLTAAVKAAATREMTTTSEYARRALLERLRADGIDPAAYAPKPSPALCTA